MTESGILRWPVRGLVALGSLATVAAGGLLATRFFGARKVSSAERLADALLDTDRLNDAVHNLPDSSEAALAQCAAYLAGVAYRAAPGLGVAGGREDTAGHSRTQSHPFTGAVVTIITEAISPEQVATYSLSIPNIGEVRGTRRVGGVRMSGLTPVRRAPDTAQITLVGGYTAQIESELLAADYLATGATRVSGLVTLRDNRGNIGRVNMGSDGGLTGTVTRNMEVVGRFHGKAMHELEFTSYKIGPAD